MPTRDHTVAVFDLQGKMGRARRSLIIGSCSPSPSSSRACVASCTRRPLSSPCRLESPSTTRRTGREAPRRWLRRVDHAGVYGLIAGTYTAFGLLALSGYWRWVVLSIVWAGALAAIAFKFTWVDAPKWISAVIGLALGWVGVVVSPQLLAEIGVAASLLVLAGGLLYTVGALVYAFRRPDPLPAVFGFHEVFHVLVIAAVACQYAAVAFFVLPEH